ncbi:Crp/Fnr family transcriptional regulator [Pseudomaricurvus alkylphenolicus]|jgi:CRP-like cAMP-binding protein|uniref:Crp/Fnr family transcriptional regulator n=1 Tax=Pseudomaricurvus alkylphenolicus TaxID=1306991 RepID=UPI0014207329|nr:Crp/Fnr family transcriptional regulator [Pseudomaricurvus alkylphenolicus]NIB38619.1 Crp/Fnr family transcriptional regulator [Pseudomaricurvus alkylphenolicus]
MHNWISELPEEIGREVIARCSSRRLSDGECLYRLGDAAEECYQVIAGRLKVCTYNHAGQEMVQVYLMAGDCIGDWPLLIDEERMNFVYACGDAEVNVLKKFHFQQLYEKYQEIPKALNRVMARRLRHTFMLAEDACLLPLRQRLARVILRMGHSIGKTDAEGGAIIEDISHDELSKLVGATRQSVGRELKKLEQEGDIEIKYGKLIIKDIAAFGKEYDFLLSLEPVVPEYHSDKSSGDAGD